MDKAQQDALKKAAGIEAAKLVENGMIAGLGTGSTVKFLVDELGRRHQEEGLEFTGVTTSRRTQAQAESYGIKIVDIDAGFERGVRPMGDWSTMMTLSKASMFSMRPYGSGRIVVARLIVRDIAA